MDPKEEIEGLWWRFRAVVSHPLSPLYPSGILTVAYGFCVVPASRPGLVNLWVYNPDAVGQARFTRLGGPLQWAEIGVLIQRARWCPSIDDIPWEIHGLRGSARTDAALAYLASTEISIGQLTDRISRRLATYAQADVQVVRQPAEPTNY